MTRGHHKLDFDAYYQRSRGYQEERGVIVNSLHLDDLRETKVWARRDQDLRDIIQIDDFIKETEERDRNQKKD